MISLRIHETNFSNYVDEKKKRIRKRLMILYFTDVLIAVFFVIVTLTGLVKFLNLYIGGRDINRLSKRLTNLHDWSGLLLGIFI